MDLLNEVASIRSIVITFILVVQVFCNPSDNGAVQLTERNLNLTLESNELVFIIFYAQWDRFSNTALPRFDEAANKIKEEYPELGKVILAKVDCDKEGSVATRFHITRYSTLKVVINGQPSKRDYRDERSTKAFVSFVKNQLEDPVKEFTGLNELLDLESDKRIIIGYFDRRDQSQYNIFRKVAMNLKDDCQFHAGFGDVLQQMHPPGEPIVVFRPDKDSSNYLNETYNGSLTNFDELYIWASEKCVPLVREITFENAEELTEEGLPFLILFHNPDDKESVRKYNKLLQKELLSEKQNINFLTADGNEFAHALHHLAKSESDLPLIAIDSFRHMYLFPNFKDMDVPGRLKQFINDLYSGKLHREFHYGPDPGTYQYTPNWSTSTGKSITSSTSMVFFSKSMFIMRGIYICLSYYVQSVLH